MAAMIAKTRNGIGKAGTKVWDDNGTFAVRLYETIVYLENRDEIRLATGGWTTQTTARRINQALAHRGRPERAHIKNATMHLDGKPFVNGIFVLEVLR